MNTKRLNEHPSSAVFKSVIALKRNDFPFRFGKIPGNIAFCDVLTESFYRRSDKKQMKHY